MRYFRHRNGSIGIVTERLLAEPEPFSLVQLDRQPLGTLQASCLNSDFRSVQSNEMVTVTGVHEGHGVFTRSRMALVLYVQVFVSRIPD